MRVLVVLLLVAAGAVLTMPGRAVPLGQRGVPPPRRRPRWRPPIPRRRGPQEPGVAQILVEVAARLRAGSPMLRAWQRALPDPAPAWAAPLLAATGPDSASTEVWRPLAGRGARRWADRLRRQHPVDGPDVVAAVAACRLSVRTGAPLAEVVDVVVAGIAEAAEANDLRRAALAGPRATARLLAWLPAGGIALGTLLGADPVAVLLGGGAGGLCLVGGAALFLAGRRWVRALLDDAERAGR